MTVSHIFKPLSIAILTGMMLVPFGTAHAARTHAVSHQATSPIDPKALRVDPSVFAPATVTTDYAPTNADLKGGWGQSYHGKSYADLGRLSGYYEYGSWAPTAGADPIEFRYYANIYGSQDGATASYSDVKSTFATNGNQLSPCNVPQVPSPCEELQVVYDPYLKVFYREVQVGLCVGEIFGQVKTAAEVDQNVTQIHRTLDAITVAGVAAMGKVCGSGPAVAQQPPSTTNTPSPIDPKVLRVDPSVFAPATVTKDYAPTNADLKGGFGEYNHTKSYADLGRLGGYYEGAKWAPTAAADPIIFAYYGNIYASEAVAAVAYNDAITQYRTTLRNPLTPCNAIDQIPPPCDDIQLEASDGSILFYREVKVGQCTGEFAVLIKTVAEADANSGTIHKTLNAVTLAGIAAMSKVCSAAPPVAQQPTLSINGMGVYHKVKGKVKLTSVLKLKEGGLFVATYAVANATGLTPSAVIDFIKAGKTLAHADMRPDTLSNGTPYFYSAGTFVKKKFVGHLTARVTITIGTATNVRSIQFTVKKGK